MLKGSQFAKCVHICQLRKFNSGNPEIMSPIIQLKGLRLSNCLICLKDCCWILISCVFDAILVNTEEGAVSVFSGAPVLVGRTNKYIERFSLKVKCDRIGSVGA